MRRIALGSSLLLAVQASIVYAAPSPGVSHDIEAERTAAIASPASDPRGGIIDGSSIGLRASDDGSDVTLTIAPKARNLLYRNGQSNWSLTLTAPLDKKTGRGDFITEEGLSDQFNVRFSFTQVFTRLGASTQAEGSVVDAYLETCGQKCWHGDLADLAHAPPEFRQNLTEAQLKILTDAEVARAKNWIWVVGASASLGYGRFKFLNPANFDDERKQNRASYTLAVSAGFNPSRGAPFFGAGYEYRVEYDAAKKNVFCLPNATPPPATKCKYDIFDAPDKTVTHDVFALVRIADLFAARRTDARFRLPLALEVRAGYDIHNNIFSVSVPAYFVMNDKGNFRGGVRFSWADRTTTSRADEFKASLFVAKSFDFFGL